MLVCMRHKSIISLYYQVELGRNDPPEETARQWVSFFGLHGDKQLKQNLT